MGQTVFAMLIMTAVYIAPHLSESDAKVMAFVSLCVAAVFLVVDMVILWRSRR